MDGIQRPACDTLAAEIRNVRMAAEAADSYAGLRDLVMRLDRRRTAEAALVGFDQTILDIIDHVESRGYVLQ